MLDCLIYDKADMIPWGHADPAARYYKKGVTHGALGQAATGQTAAAPSRITLSCLEGHQLRWERPARVPGPSVSPAVASHCGSVKWWCTWCLLWSRWALASTQPLRPHAGKRRNKTHTLCRRCGRRTFHIQKTTCSSCGYPAARIRKCEHHIVDFSTGMEKQLVSCCLHLEEPGLLVTAKRSLVGCSAAAGQGHNTGNCCRWAGCLSSDCVGFQGT